MTPYGARLFAWFTDIRTWLGALPPNLKKPWIATAGPTARCVEYSITVPNKIVATDAYAGDGQLKATQEAPDAEVYAWSVSLYSDLTALYQTVTAGQFTTQDGCVLVAPP